MPTPVVVFEEAADKEKAEEKEKGRRRTKRKMQVQSLTCSSIHSQPWRKPRKNAWQRRLGTHSWHHDLLLAKVRQMIDQAARTLTTGESLRHTVKDARALNAEIVFKTRTYYIVGS